MQMALSLRAQAIVIIAMALALVLGTLAAPARAGEDHDDLEAARSAALETVNHKINSLKECRQDAKTDAAWAIYSEGIEELGGIKERILGGDNVYEINVLKDRAKAVWAETKELAAQADTAKEEDEGDEEGEEGGQGTDEEEQAITDALDALQAQTMLYQQQVANTIDPFSGTLETGAAALAAGDELLAAIAAARLAETEEEIINAWETVMAARNAYRIALIAHNNVAGGIFTGSDPFPT